MPKLSSVFRPLVAGAAAGLAVMLAASSDLAKDVWTEPWWQERLLYALMGVGALLGISTAFFVERLQSKQEGLTEELTDVKNRLDETRSAVSREAEAAVLRRETQRLVDFTRRAAAGALVDPRTPTGTRWRLGIEDGTLGAWLASPVDGDPGLAALFPAPWTPSRGHMAEPEIVWDRSDQRALEFVDDVDIGLPGYAARLHLRVVVPASTALSDARIATHEIHSAINSDDLRRELTEFYAVRLEAETRARVLDAA